MVQAALEVAKWRERHNEKESPVHCRNLHKLSMNRSFDIFEDFDSFFDLRHIEARAFDSARCCVEEGSQSGEELMLILICLKKLLKVQL